MLYLSETRNCALTRETRYMINRRNPENCSRKKNMLAWCRINVDSIWGQCRLSIEYIPNKFNAPVGYNVGHMQQKIWRKMIDGVVRDLSTQFNEKVLRIVHCLNKYVFQKTLFMFVGNLKKNIWMLSIFEWLY